jgi:AmiR/NasT family two-component response regulator
LAQHRCGEAEAFDLLRQASQRLNEPVRELAARIVTNNTAASGPHISGQRPEIT